MIKAANTYSIQVSNLIIILSFLIDKGADCAYIISDNISATFNGSTVDFFRASSEVDLWFIMDYFVTIRLHANIPSCLWWDVSPILIQTRRQGHLNDFWYIHNNIDGSSDHLDPHQLWALSLHPIWSLYLNIHGHESNIGTIPVSSCGLFCHEGKLTQCYLVPLFFSCMAQHEAHVQQ